MREKPLVQCNEHELLAVGSSTAACHWLLGEAASLWCKKYSRGRTISDFAELTGWVYESVNRAVAVFDRMGSVREKFPLLKWSHFRAAMNWDDSEHWLEMATENEWSKDKMRTERAESLAQTDSSESQACDSDGPNEITAPPPRELSQEQLDEVDNTELLKQLRKSLAKYRTRFGRSGWSDMADALAQFEHGLRDALES